MGDLLKGVHLLPQSEFETAVENNQIDDDVIYVTPEDFSSLAREQTEQIAKNTEDIAINKTNIESNAAAIESLKNSSGGSSEDLVEIKNTIQEIILRDINQDSRLDDIENNYATEEFVISNGGKIDKITINGVEQSIVNKTVDIVVPDTSAIEDRLAKTVNLDEAQTITGPKTFTEHIYISNADGTVDRISHLNNNFIIHSGATNSAVLNIDEGLEKIYAFNEELAFKSDIAEAAGTTVYVAGTAVADLSFSADPQTQINLLAEGLEDDKSELSAKVSKSGDTMTGELIASAGVAFGNNKIKAENSGNTFEIVHSENNVEKNIFNYTHGGIFTLNNSETPLIIQGSNDRPSYVSGSGVMSDLALENDIPTKTSQLINDANYLTTIPSEYVTETELSSKGYDTIINVNSKIDAANAYTDTKIANLMGTVPETLDTLEEVAQAIKDNETVVDALNSAIGNKADKTTVTELTNKVNTNENNISSLQSVKEDKSTVTALANRITTNETNILSLQENKADKSDLGVSEFSDQYVRITNLNSGIYKLTYDGFKYIYYNGTSGYETQTTYSKSVVYLFVEHYTGNVEERWHWYFLGGTAKPSYFFTGTTTASSGNLESIAFSSTHSVDDNSDSLLTSKGAYADTSRVVLNGTSVRDASFYAPTSYGTSGYVLQSAGNTAPKWVDLNDIKPEYDYSEIKNAPTIPEGAKLYTETGTNTDGAMTQKASTDALNLKADKNASNITVSSWLSKLGTNAYTMNFTKALGVADQNKYQGIYYSGTIQTDDFIQIGPNLLAYTSSSWKGFSINRIDDTSVSFVQTYQSPSSQSPGGAVSIKVTGLKPSTKYYTSYDVVSATNINLNDWNFFNSGSPYIDSRLDGSFTTNSSGEYEFFCSFGVTSTSTATLTLKNIMFSEYGTVYAPLKHRYVVDFWTSSDMKTWYRIWSDGWKECGLIVTSSNQGSVTLPIEFSNKNYQVDVNVDTDNYNQYAYCGAYSKRTNGFAVFMVHDQSSLNNAGIYCHCQGY